MKLLIIAGPYEADRIRRAAVAAGIEALAVEPGESLSGWITATRPEVIVLAPQIVSSDLAKALGKIRAVPRGRVPIVLVGDSEDREKLEGAADGFFVRPVATDALFARAEELAAQVVARSGDEPGSGPQTSSGSGPFAAGESGGEVTPVRPATLRPLVATRENRPKSARDSAGAQTRDGGAPPSLRKTAERWPPALSVPGRTAADVGAAGGGPAGGRLGERRHAPRSEALAKDMDAAFDADIDDVVRAVAVLRQARAVLLPQPAAPAAAEDHGALVRAQLLELHARVQDGDYFQILGVSPNADGPEIERAAAESLRALSPEVLPASIGSALGAEVEEIRLVLTEAARLMSNDTLRLAYRRHLSGPRVNDHASSTPTPTPTATPDATTPAPNDGPAVVGEGVTR